MHQHPAAEHAVIGMSASSNWHYRSVVAGA